MSDYVGRALCEAATSVATCALTLTYAPRDDLADRVLTPPHFQRFIRSLRRSGHSLRYLVAGEYGELRGRAHFHCILFFQECAGGKLPDWPQQKNFQLSHWPHGHVFADWNADDKALRYVCKYLLKSAKAGEGWFSLSKKPALGAEYFASLADRLIQLQVWPRNFEYRPPDASDSKSYLLTGASRRDFLARLVAEMGRPSPEMVSEWVQQGLEKLYRWQALNDAEYLPDDLFMADMSERLADAQAKAEREFNRKASIAVSERIDRALNAQLDSWASSEW